MEKPGRALLFAVLLNLATALIVSESRAADPPGGLNVNVVNTPTVRTLPSLPSGAFSDIVQPDSSGAVVEGPDPAGTRYAITSFTAANFGNSPAQVALFVRSGPTTDCLNFSTKPTHTEGPEVSVPSGETVHLSFPQPFIITIVPNAGDASCLLTIEGGSIPLPTVKVTVVGYKF